MDRNEGMERKLFGAACSVEKTIREQTAHVQVQPAPRAVVADRGWEEADAQPVPAAGALMTPVDWGAITPDRVCKDAEDWVNSEAMAHSERVEVARETVAEASLAIVL